MMGRVLASASMPRVFPGHSCAWGRYRAADQTLREPLEPDRIYALG